MKAQIIRAFGGPELFEEADLPDPEAGAGEILVRLHAASVNPVDYKVRAAGPPGVAPALPAVLGCDMAEAGKLRPLLDQRRFALAEVADAHRHLESGQALGKVVIDIATA